MAADLETFKRLYLCSLTFYSFITGLADFSFTERCYWYLQRALNPCLKAAPLSVQQKPGFHDFLQILFPARTRSARAGPKIVLVPLRSNFKYIYSVVHLIRIRFR